MKAVSGLMSRMRCRNGAKSGLASGMRMDSTILPPSSVKRCLKAVAASVPARRSEAGPGHGKAHADFDHVLRRRRSGDERERGGGRDGDEAALHVSLPPVRLVVRVVV